jgi:hypothetical protein
MDFGVHVSSHYYIFLAQSFHVDPSLLLATYIFTGFLAPGRPRMQTVSRTVSHAHMGPCRPKRYQHREEG